MGPKCKSTIVLLMIDSHSDLGEMQSPRSVNDWTKKNMK